MEEGAVNSSVPSFLIKLWTLVDDCVLDEVIRWSESGHSFCIVNEYIFSSKVLPKYFKHSNLSSFIRQLNIYGFRKVAFESGRIIDGNRVLMEFQHPLFKKGSSKLLSKIKRKVPTMKIENVKLYPDELRKIMTEVQEMKDKHNNMDARISELKKDYDTVSLEMTNLTQKHCKQQQLITQILQFILSLFRGKYMVNTNRKRSLQVISGTKASRYARPYFHISEEKKKEAMEILKNGYTLVEEKYKSLLDSILPSLKDESKNEVSSMEQANGDDGKRPKVSIQDVPMNEDSQTIDWDLDISELQDLITEESFGQEAKDISLEFVTSQDNNSVMTEEKQDTQCNTTMNRDEVHIHCTEENLMEVSKNKVTYESDNISEPLTFMANETVTLFNSDVLRETDTVMKNEEQASPLEANGEKDQQVLQYKKYALLSKVEELPINNFEETLQDPNELHLDDLKNSWNVLPDLDDPNYFTLNVSSMQKDVANPVELFVPQLCSETTEESTLFPLLYLSPVTSFAEEATTVEPST